MVTALDIVPGSQGKAYLVGTAQCDIWKAAEGRPADMAMFGHSATLLSVTANPRSDFAHVFATISEANRVAVWSAASKQVWSHCDGMPWHSGI